MTYEELVSSINEGLKSEMVYHADFEGKTGPPLQEVNAWTYWQGAGVRNPRIMILGQDWGSSRSGEWCLKAIDEMIADPDEDGNVRYFQYQIAGRHKDQEFVTDRNLCDGLSRLGYERVMEKRYPDLFFTNLIPGFRKSGKSTGEFRSKWISEKVKSDLRELVDILKPKVVVCLGKNTFIHTARIFGKDHVLRKASWNQYLNNNPAPYEAKTISGDVVYLAAMPHPGFFGTMNRKRGGGSCEEDWDRLANWMKEHKI